MGDTLTKGWHKGPQEHDSWCCEAYRQSNGTLSTAPNPVMKPDEEPAALSFGWDDADSQLLYPENALGGKPESFEEHAIFLALWCEECDEYIPDLGPWAEEGCCFPCWAAWWLDGPALAPDLDRTLWQDAIVDGYLPKMSTDIILAQAGVVYDG